MATLSINLAGIKDTPIPDGVYHVNITAAKAGLTQKGDPKLDVVIKIAEGSEEGRAVYDTLTISADPDSFAMRKLKQLLIACGYDPNFNDPDFNPESLIGETVTAKLRMGKPSTEIDKSTGQPYPARVGVVEYSPYGGAPSAEGMIADLGIEED